MAKIREIMFIIKAQYGKVLQNANAQCGNYGNSLSQIFDKNFVKVIVLLKKLLKS